jgi:hypothetical protein
VPVLPRFAAEVFAEHADSFVVARLPWLGSPEGDLHALVLFVRAEELWHTIAAFTRIGLNAV